MKHEVLMHVVSSRALEVFAELNAQDLANIVWALAKLEVKDEARV